MNYCNLVNYNGVQKFSLKIKNEKSTIEKRRVKFVTDLSKFISEYDRELLNDFYKFWSEPNKSHTKMRFELERTWDLNLRLQRWKRTSSNKPNLNHNLITN